MSNSSGQSTEAEAMKACNDIKGMFFPLPTVFDGTGEVDDRVMHELVDWYVAVGVTALLPLGSFGQGPACSTAQRKHVAELVVRRVAGRVPVVVHIGAVDPYTSIELGLHAKAIGAAGVALVGPYYYNDRNEWELLEHYKMVDAAVQLPLLLYYNTPYSGYSISPQFTATLAKEIPNCFGVKLAAGNTREAQSYLRAAGDRLNIFIGEMNDVIPTMLMGVKGAINPPLSLTPELGVELMRAIEAAEIDRALHLQLKILDFQSRLPRGYGRGITKEGLRLRGFDVKEYPRWPTKPMTAEDRGCLREALESVVSLQAVPAHA